MRKNFADRKKVLVDVIRNEVARQGGSSVLTDTSLLTIVDGEEKRYTVLMEFGSHYAVVEE